MTDTGTDRASDSAPAYASPSASGPSGGAEPPDAGRSPRIGRLKWGLMEAEGCLPARTSSCTRAAATRGTGPCTHSTGVQPGDVRELLERGATVVVLSLGMDERLTVAPAPLELLRQAGAEVHVKETRAAAALYNTLAAAGRPVGGLFHSTC
ncbi:MTH938/NDUFAF3 family protein [Streptomyces yangpuensis]|uniref:MTH938/NDUFAF3 family protein n=1 Tax=Streptomyces yangpuensis TaxID=1648182 RepID=UPI00364BDF7D